MSRYSTVISYMHRLNLALLTPLKKSAVSIAVTRTASLATFQNERKMSNDSQTLSDVMSAFKKNIQDLFVAAGGVYSQPVRIFRLVDPGSGLGHCFIFITSVRMDGSSMSPVADAFILPMSFRVTPQISPELRRISSQGDLVFNLKTPESVMWLWKQYLPIATDRCRTWTHKATCEYRTALRVPLSLAWEESPLCSCGEGLHNLDFRAIEEWRVFAPFVTRAAIGFMFGMNR